MKRAILYLERISLDNLVRRIMKPSMNIQQLETELIRAIRGEYEHNLSQQLYMGNGAWDSVKGATEEIIKLIHVTASQVKAEKKTAMDLSAALFQVWGQMELNPVRAAIEKLKKEIRQIY